MSNIITQGLCTAPVVPPPEAQWQPGGLYDAPVPAGLLEGQELLVSLTDGRLLSAEVAYADQLEPGDLPWDAVAWWATVG